MLNFNIGDVPSITSRLYKREDPADPYSKYTTLSFPEVAEDILILFSDIMTFMVSRNSEHLIIGSPDLYMTDHDMIEKLILEDKLPDRLISRLKKHLMYILNIDGLYTYALESLHTAIAEKDI